jgi:hypothetical protein
MQSEVIRLLDDIHAALLDGDVAATAPLSVRMESILGTTQSLSNHDLHLIRAKAARNAITLKAAMQGVRSAQRRLKELREAASGHRTYGPKGHRAVISDKTGILSQRV